MRDLGISRDLAAYAVKLAGLPDEAWEGWHKDIEPTQAKVANAAGDYWARAEAHKR